MWFSCNFIIFSPLRNPRNGVESYKSKYSCKPFSCGINVPKLLAIAIKINKNIANFNDDILKINLFKKPI